MRDSAEIVSVCHDRAARLMPSLLIEPATDLMARMPDELVGVDALSRVGCTNYPPPVTNSGTGGPATKW